MRIAARSVQNHGKPLKTHTYNSNIAINAFPKALEPTRRAAKTEAKGFNRPLKAFKTHAQGSKK